MAVPRLAKLNAIRSDPTEVIIQAIIAVLGFEAAAKEAAEVNMPEPMQLPTTIAVAAISPSSLFSSILPGSIVSLILLIYFPLSIVQFFLLLTG
jgi:hypothetical protein